MQIHQHARVVLLCLLALVALQVRAHAAEETHEKFNFAFEFPAGGEWARLPDRPLKRPLLFRAEVKNPSLGRMLTVAVLRTAPTATLRDEDYVRGLKTGILKQAPGMSIVSEVVESYEGTDALRLRLDLPQDASTMRIHQLHLLSDSMHYVLTARGVGDGAGVDADLEQLLAGFRFLTPPTLPPESGADRVGYLIGFYGFPVLLIALVSWVVLKIRKWRASAV